MRKKGGEVEEMGVDGEYVEKGWKEVVGCMKCELTFMAGHGIFEEGCFRLSFLAR